MKTNRGTHDKVPRSLSGFAVLMIAAIFSFSLFFLIGCDPGTGGNNNNSELNLPAITEQTTGRATITGTGITVAGLPGSTNVAEQTDQHGEKFSITNGKLSFTLPQTPTDTCLWSEGMRHAPFIFGSDGYDGASCSPDDANFASVLYFSWGSGQNSNMIERMAISTNGYSWFMGSQIMYVYTDRDVTLTQAQRDITEYGITYRHLAVNLALKQGWNLVQQDQRATSGITTVTVKIADKNVPWALSDVEGSTSSGGQ